MLLTVALWLPLAAATGIVVGKRTKTGASLGGATGSTGQLSVSLHRTGVRP
ncbi:MAG TPA: hypothetical protein VNN19_11460 [bacterium]|nr:hypothetical protein [bacterium]